MDEHRKHTTPGEPADLVAQFAALPADRQAALLAINTALEEWAPVRRSVRPVQPCGTWAAYKRHHRAGQEPCEACREASRRRDRNRRRTAA